MRQETETKGQRILVLGIGNLLMGDDGVGVRLAEALGQAWDAGKQTAEALGQEYHGGNIRFAAGETDVDYCLDELEDCDSCVIIDASCSGGEPCSVDTADLREVFENIGPALTFHEFDLLHAMKRERRLKEGILITVEACYVGFSAELSPLMRERFSNILREVDQIIKDKFT